MRDQIPPSKIFFDKYRSAESGMMVTTRFPAPSFRATFSDAKTAAPPLDPGQHAFLSPPESFTVSKASSSVTIMTSSHTEGSKVFGMKLAPMPSTLCGPGGPPPRTDPCVSTA